MFSRRLAENLDRAASPPPTPSAGRGPRIASRGWRRFRAFAVRTMARCGLALALVPVAVTGAGVGGLTAWLRGAPGVREFEAYDPPQASLLLDRHSSGLAALYEQQRFVVALRDMPPILPKAFVAIEDERFHSHVGVDPQGILRAFGVNLLRGEFAQGASTITQQTARNVVERLGREKSLQRKVSEVLLALQMEHRYTKDQILEVYLNQIYLGSGAYGVEAAAHRYFGKPASRLTLAECATIAGLPQLPERYSPVNDIERARERRDAVLFKLVQLGDITDEEYGASVLDPVEVNPTTLQRSRAPYFVDAVRTQIGGSGDLGDVRLHAAGLMVRTTVEPELQDIAERVIREGIEEEELEWVAARQDRWAAERLTPGYLDAPFPGQVRMASVVRFFDNSLVVELPGGWRGDLPIPAATADWFREGPMLERGWGVDIEVTEIPGDGTLFRGRLLPRHRMQGALVCLDAATGDVRALVGGREYYDRANNGFFNRATRARRQVGSTIKPFFFAAALERGWDPSTMLDDYPRTFSDGYTPRNYDGEFHGRVTMRQALEQSRNLPTINLVERVGLRNAIAHVARFNRLPENSWRLPREFPVALGITAMSPLELAAAYQPLANGGMARGPRLIEGLWTLDGRERPAPTYPAPQRLMTENAALHMTSMLASVMTHGTGRRVLAMLPPDAQHRVAGKSGTTNDNRDAWFAGYTPHEVVVVWIGFDQTMALAPGRSGGRAAGPIWGRFVAESWALKSPDQREAALAGAPPEPAAPSVEEDLAQLPEGM